MCFDLVRICHCFACDIVFRTLKQNLTDDGQTAGFAATIGLAAIELLNLIFAIQFRIKQRRVRTVRVFATTPRVYDKLDASMPEDDEVQLLDRRGQMQ